MPVVVVLSTVLADTITPSGAGDDPPAATMIPPVVEAHVLTVFAWIVIHSAMARIPPNPPPPVAVLTIVFPVTLTSRRKNPELDWSDTRMPSAVQSDMSLCAMVTDSPPHVVSITPVVVPVTETPTKTSSMVLSVIRLLDPRTLMPDPAESVILLSVAAELSADER